MSQQDLSRVRSGQKPGFSIYTMMLIISFVAILIACLLLWLELKELGGWGAWTKYR